MASNSRRFLTSLLWLKKMCKNSTVPCKQKSTIYLQCMCRKGSLKEFIEKRGDKLYFVCTVFLAYQQVYITNQQFRCCYSSTIVHDNDAKNSYVMYVLLQFFRREVDVIQQLWFFASNLPIWSVVTRVHRIDFHIMCELYVKHDHDTKEDYGSVEHIVQFYSTD